MMEVVAEALALGSKASLNSQTLRRARLGGSARSFVLKNHAQRLIGNAIAPGFRAELMRKDSRVAVTTL